MRTVHHGKIYHRDCYVKVVQVKMQTRKSN